MPADLAWPRWAVPLPTLEGHAQELLAAVGRMEVEAGPPLQWGDFDTDYRTADLRLFNMSKAQQLAFDRWYHDDVAEGTLPFDVQIRDGRSADWWTARVLDVWESGWSSGYRVTLTIRLLLIGEPFAARGDVSAAGEVDAALQLRAVSTAVPALRGEVDAWLTLLAAPLPVVEIAGEVDVVLTLAAATDFAIAGEVDAVLTITAVGALPDGLRVTEDDDERVTEDGAYRVVEH